MTDIDPSKVRTLIDLDPDHQIEGARQSLLMDKQVVEKLVEVLNDDKQNSMFRNPQASTLLRSFIARGFYTMSQTLGEEFIEFMRGIGSYADLIKTLINDANTELTEADQPLLSLTMLELRADQFRDMVTEKPNEAEFDTKDFEFYN